ncbi:response regulator transcription factor [Micavibrio aeruginosavorus]|uniref:response regulator transcription factor n=1 Tax=Micavibrio aeruginosavorus TaxID=349221 RepID=UPI003F4AA390
MKTPTHTILIVDDDPLVQQILKEPLQYENYNVLLAGDIAAMEKVLRTCQPSLILLDHMLPGEKGIDALPRIRDLTSAPIIMISSRDDLASKIEALESGADDYLCKPFQIRELFARIKVQLRHHSKSFQRAATATAQNTDHIQFGNWVLDRNQFQLFDRDSKSAGLTLKEFHLLEALVSSPNRVLTREQILDKVHNGNFNVTDRAIDTQIARIRKKLGDHQPESRMIQSVRGLGYKFSSDAIYASEGRKMSAAV